MPISEVSSAATSISALQTSYTFIDKLEIPLTINCGDHPENYTLEWDVTYNSTINLNTSWSQEYNKKSFVVLAIHGARDYFYVNGNYADYFHPGDDITFMGTAYNSSDGVYIVDHITANLENEQTWVWTTELIPTAGGLGTLYLGSNHASVQLSKFSFNFTSVEEEQTSVLYINTTDVHPYDEISLILYLINSTGTRVAFFGTFEAPLKSEIVTPTETSLTTWLIVVTLITIAFIISLIIFTKRGREAYCGLVKSEEGFCKTERKK